MIRRVLVFGILALLLNAVESSLLLALGADDVALHLSLGLLLYLSASAGGIEGVAGTAVVGWAWDLFSGMPPGLGPFLAVFLFLGARILSQGVDFSGPILVFVAAAAEATHLVGALVLLAMGGAMGNLQLGAAAPPLLWQVLLSALLAPAVYGLAGFVDRVVGGEQPDTGEVWLR